MDDPTTPLSTVSSRPDIDLHDELKAAKGVILLLLISMTCIAAAVSLYFYRQVVLMNRQVTEAKRIVSDYQSNSVPRIAWFIDSLQAFGKTNPDFSPTLAKYNLLGPPPVTAPVAPQKK
jgi:hypothetical protein